MYSYKHTYALTQLHTFAFVGQLSLLLPRNHVGAVCLRPIPTQSIKVTADSDATVIVTGSLSFLSLKNNTFKGNVLQFFQQKSLIYFDSSYAKKDTCGFLTNLPENQIN